MKTAYIVVGAQWGDEGKGLISAYLSARENFTYVARAGTGANAEHGLFLRDNKTYLKVNQLPLGWMFNENAQIRVGSGVAVDPVKLKSEINRYGLSGRVKIDFRCPIITPTHIEAERTSKGMSAIGSTFSGTGYCKSDFVLRKAYQAREDIGCADLITDTSKDLNSACKNGEKIGIESSQGTWLGLATSYDYPNCTSDNVSAVSAMDDVLLNWQYVKEVVLVVKALPTREGAGSMGSSRIMSKEEVREKGLVEPSSIGGVDRVKADAIDINLLKESVEINGATQIALTFCDHYDTEITGALTHDDVTDKVWDLVDKIEYETKVPVTILNTGKAFNNIIDLSTFNSIDWERIENKLNSFKANE